MLKTDLMQIEEVNRRCCVNLWNMAQCGEQAGGLSPRIVFPTYRAGECRVSEQEARFAFVEALAGTSLYYSVETPTSEEYCFTGSSGNARSAQTDLTVCRSTARGLEEMANVEFKCGAPPLLDISKDIQKLVKEQEKRDLLGNWFHVLRNADRGTFKMLFEKRFVPALESHLADHQVDILFCVCILEKNKAAYYRWYSSKDHPELDSFFSLDDGRPCGSWEQWMPPA